MTTGDQSRHVLLSAEERARYRDMTKREVEVAEGAAELVFEAREDVGRDRVEKLGGHGTRAYTGGVAEEYVDERIEGTRRRLAVYKLALTIADAMWQERRSI